LNDLYFQNIKENINNLFSGSNSNVTLFGPTNSGKSYILLGSPQEDGILRRSIRDILNKIDLNKRINQNHSFVLSMVAYQIVNSQIYDILSRNKNSEVFLNKDYYEEFQAQLTKYDMYTMKDLDNMDIDIHKSSLNSCVVVSLQLDKISNLRENVNQRESYSQVDFIELPSSQYGLPKGDMKIYNHDAEDGTLFKTVNNVFNSLYNNIVSSAVNLNPTYESLLTLVMKPTINPESNITFITCILPCELSSFESEKALKV